MSVLPVIKKKCTPFRIPPLFIAPLDLTFIAHLSPIARQKPNTGNVFLNEVLDVPRFPGVVQIEGLKSMRPRYCHCHPPPPPVCDFFFISRWVGRSREFSQESWLDYLTWSLPTPAGSLRFISSLSLRKVQPSVTVSLSWRKTREKSRFLAFSRHRILISLFLSSIPKERNK